MTRNSYEFFDQATGVFYIKHVEDVEPLLDENQADKNNGTNGFSTGRTYRKIGSIPMIVIEKVLREYGINLLDGSEEARKYCREFLRKNNKFMTVDKL